MHSTIVDLFIVLTAVTPVKDLPAPHGNTLKDVNRNIKINLVGRGD